MTALSSGSLQPGFLELEVIVPFLCSESKQGSEPSKLVSNLTPYNIIQYMSYEVERCWCRLTVWKLHIAESGLERR